MGGRSMTQAILFADVCDSSRLVEELGAEEALGTLEVTLDELARSTERHGGRVVDRIGDEVMSAFPGAAAAARSAVDMQRGVRGMRRRGDLPAVVSVRVGFHYGEVLEDQGRLFGDVIYTARRMATLAHREQVYFPSEIRAELDGDGGFALREVGAAVVPGKRGRYDVVELVWDPDLLTLGPTTLPSELRARAVELSYDGESWWVGEDRTQITFGRDGSCDLTIADRSVSRQHGRVEARPGSFVLVDHSTNGTRVLEFGRGWRAVHRDETRLLGSGLFSLGPGPEAQVVQYRLRD